MVKCYRNLVCMFVSIIPSDCTVNWMKRVSRLLFQCSQSHNLYVLVFPACFLFQVLLCQKIVNIVSKLVFSYQEMHVFLFIYRLYLYYSQFLEKEISKLIKFIDCNSSSINIRCWFVLFVLVCCTVIFSINSWSLKKF